MKCPKCEHKQNYKSGTACQNCGYKYIFDPKETNLNDFTFNKLITKLSENQSNNLHFTFNQIYAQYIKQSSSFWEIFWGIVKVFASDAMMVLLSFIYILLIITLIDKPDKPNEIYGIAFIMTILYGYRIYLVVKRSNLRYISKSEFMEYFIKWEKQNGKVEVMLWEVSLNQENKTFSESDIYDYGAENLLIVDKDIYVDLLVKNGFHQQFKTVVISENMYPNHLSEKVNKMLSKNPKLPVYLLHNADSKGLEMAERIRKSDKFVFQNHEIIDLGLTQEHFQNAKIFRKFRKMTSANFAPLDLLTYNQICLLFENSLQNQEPFLDDLQVTDSMGSVMDFG